MSAARDLKAPVDLVREVAETGSTACRQLRGRRDRYAVRRGADDAARMRRSVRRVRASSRAAIRQSGHGRLSKRPRSIKIRRSSPRSRATWARPWLGINIDDIPAGRTHAGARLVTPVTAVVSGTCVRTRQPPYRRLAFWRCRATFESTWPRSKPLGAMRRRGSPSRRPRRDRRSSSPAANRPPSVGWPCSTE